MTANDSLVVRTMTFGKAQYGIRRAETDMGKPVGPAATSTIKAGSETAFTLPG
jgi:hypothetical protein